MDIFSTRKEVLTHICGPDYADWHRTNLWRHLRRHDKPHYHYFTFYGHLVQHRGDKFLVIKASKNDAQAIKDFKF